MAITANEIIELKQQEKIFKLLVEAVTDYAIFVLSPEGFILTWNPGAEKLKGYSENDIIGKHFSIFYSEGDQKRNHPMEELKIAKQRGTYHEEGWRYKKNGEAFWASVTIHRLTDEHGKFIGFAKVTKDLTEKKKADEEIAKADKQLKEANRSLELKVRERTFALQEAINAKDNFLSIASHELNTPLTSLKLQTQIRKRQLLNKNLEYFTPEKLLSMIENDDKQIGRLTRLVEDMLDISRINIGRLTIKKEYLNLSHLVMDVVNRFLPQLEYLHTKVTTNIEEDIIGHWDPFRIEQVINNLLTNAMKYGASKPITIEVKKNGLMASFSVKDEGRGIDPKDHQRVFQQFERAISASEVSGFGLGLFIAKQIVESHQGRIYVDSEVGKGARFVVELPLS